MASSESRACIGEGCRKPAKEGSSVCEECFEKSVLFIHCQSERCRGYIEVKDGIAHCNRCGKTTTIAGTKEDDIARSSDTLDDEKEKQTCIAVDCKGQVDSGFHLCDSCIGKTENEVIPVTCPGNNNTCNAMCFVKELKMECSKCSTVVSFCEKVATDQMKEAQCPTDDSASSTGKDQTQKQKSGLKSKEKEKSPTSQEREVDDDNETVELDQADIADQISKAKTEGDTSKMRLTFEAYLLSSPDYVYVVIDNYKKTNAKGKDKPVSLQLRKFKETSTSSEFEKVTGTVPLERDIFENLVYHYEKGNTKTFSWKSITKEKETFYLDKKKFLPDARCITSSKPKKSRCLEEFRRIDGVIYFGEERSNTNVFSRGFRKIKDLVVGKDHVTTAEIVSGYGEAALKHFVERHLLCRDGSLSDCVLTLRYIQDGGFVYQFVTKDNNDVYNVHYDRYREFWIQRIVHATITGIERTLTVIQRTDALELNKKALVIILILMELDLWVSDPEKRDVLFTALSVPLYRLKGKFLLQNMIEESKETHRDDVLSCLLKFCKKHMDKEESGGKTFVTDKWLNVIPYIHYLSGATELELDMNPENVMKSSWWQSEEVETLVNTFKKSNKWWNAFGKLKEFDYDMTRFDKWIPRTMVQMAGLGQLPSLVDHEAVTIDISCGMLCYTLRKENTISPESEKKIVESLTKIGDKLSKTSEVHQKENLTVAMKIICMIYEEVHSKLKRESVIMGEIYYAAFQATRYIHNPSWHNIMDRQFTEENMVNRLTEWLSLDETDTTAKRWDEYYGRVHHMKDNAKSLWQTTILFAFKEHCKKIPRKALFTIHDGNPKEYCKEIRDTVQSVAEEFISCMVKTSDEVSDLMSSRNRAVGSTTSQILLNDWQFDTCTANTTFLISILESKTFVHFLRDKVSRSDSSILTRDVTTIIDKGIQDLKTTFEDLQSGRISVKELHIILENTKQFVYMTENINGDLSQADAFELINVRRKEIQRAKEYISMAKGVERICQRLQNVDNQVLTTRIKQITDDDRTRMIDICAIQPWKPGMSEADVKAFTDLLPSETLQKVGDLNRCIDSPTFNRIWDRVVKVEEQKLSYHEKFSLSHVIDKIWCVARDEWSAFSQRLVKDTWTIADADKYFKNMTTEKVRNELQKIQESVSTQWLDKRIEELNRYRLLRNAEDIVKVLLKLQTTYCLKGNFSELESIAKTVGNELSLLKDINLSSVEKSKVLQNADAERRNCLEVFSNCSQLVKWARTEFKDGLADLKTFVDLALISAGDGDINVDKVLCIQSSVVAYSRLIFDLHKNLDKCDSTLLLKYCHDVWTNLDKDKYIPQQLLDTNRDLEWFQSVKKAYGSVHVTALHQAAAINERGYYRIGNIRRKDIRQGGKLEMTDIIELSVPPGEKKDNVVNYTFEDLNDLQSRMMLVAGRKTELPSHGTTASEKQINEKEMAKENMTKFSMTFDSITRLAGIYMKLWSSGCILFKVWNADIYCSKMSKIGLRVQFGSGKHREIYEGDTQDGDIFFWINKISDFMENCLEHWMEYVETKREDFFELNYFTMDQIVILQKELSNESKDMSPKLYPLLTLVNDKCSEKDLEKAKILVQTKIDEEKLQKQLQDEKTKTNKPNAEEMEKRIFIDKMMKSGMSKKLAMIALLNGIKPTEFNKGKIWCMQNKGKEHVLTSNSVGKKLKTEDIFDLWIDKNDVDNIEGNALIDKMLYLWTSFLSSAASSVSDFLSIEHVARILKQISKGKQVIERPFNGLRTKEPNLIICEKEKTFDCILSVYIQGKEYDTPLPKPDEVLLCTEKTTYEMVDIFFRRALQVSQNRETGKVYCFVNPERLKFEVAEKADSLLVEYVRQAHGQCFHLVVICNEESEIRSSITSSLERYKVPSFTLFPSNEIQMFVQKQFMESRKESAAVIDFDRSTVRIVTSISPGSGKSLFCKRNGQKLQKQFSYKDGEEHTVTLRLQHREVDVNKVMEKLLPNTLPPGKTTARLIHFDFSFDVLEGVNHLLFNLLILGFLENDKGFLWRKSKNDLYMIECMPFKGASGEMRTDYNLVELLPKVACRSPQETLDILLDTPEKPKETCQNDSLFDEQEYQSESFQRVLGYLDESGSCKTDMKSALETLQKSCGLENPTWAEIANFVNFFNTQLVDFEASVFCQEDILPGFQTFVLKFLQQMSKDFSTRSLTVAQPGQQVMQSEGDQDLSKYQMDRKWESSHHPYLFFNSDHMTMSFLGFNVDKNGNLIDEKTKEVFVRDIMDAELMKSLELNGVPLNEIFNELKREEMLKKLGTIMGNPDVEDPDPTYELTSDNVKKILAIYMRFRCNIPVIVMGETGCGKTRLVKFMCDLQKPKTKGDPIKNMILMKVHGGSTEKDIVEKVKKAEELAIRNTETIAKLKQGTENAQSEEKTEIFTVLFLDEANTTEAIGLIKEIMCDRSVDGKPLVINANLKIVAACNPYRRQPKQFIENLEKAGLGYKVKASDTKDKMGKIPMRQLVYRVQPMPRSMLPLVWDFGQLDEDVEKLYIAQMVKRCIRSGVLPEMDNLELVMSEIFTACQTYMRDQKDDCKFVSLRDVERGIKMLTWFYTTKVIHEELEKRMTQWSFPCTDAGRISRSLVLALGVCYMSSLRHRDEFSVYIAKYFKDPFQLKDNTQIQREIESCQELFLDNVQIGDNIARNRALKENVFMMVTCIEQRIPLFLVGKPGSSKSLTKTIVSDSMQETASHCELFKHFKKVQMISFQCSHLATSEGIIGTFKQAANIQKERKNDLHKYVAVVVLDEVGLAEDSEKMPLKTLHPLLEEGFIDEEAQEIGMAGDNSYTQVGFIGISNWALDPAKMNRGILVQRPVPDDNELINTAKGICQTNSDVYHLMDHLIQPLAQAYIQLFDQAAEKREFFGLRDFYCLIKMIYAFANEDGKAPTWRQIVHAVKRNFGGWESVDPVSVFKDCLKIVNIEEQRENDPDVSDAGLIRHCLEFKDELSGCESRYLLLLTENYGALSILEHMMSASQTEIHIVFGSSFPNDQELTTICRNINRVKMHMATGNRAVLLNLDNIYESLYDALNQYYVYLGGERYVDLGLGTTRLKCKVDRNFRLVVVADKQHVYDKFPIPLINRLEKHVLTVRTMMTPEQNELADELKKWAEGFRIENEQLRDIFIGYNDDTAAAIILQAWDNTPIGTTKEEGRSREVWRKAKEILLWACSPNAIIRYSKKIGVSDKESKEVQRTYFHDQEHDTLVDFLKQKSNGKDKNTLFVQTTTHAKLLTKDDLRETARQIGVVDGRSSLLPLKAFGTEQEFINALNDFVKRSGQLLIIQCAADEVDANHIACTRHCIQQELQYIKDSDKCFVILLIHVPRVACDNFKGFQTGFWSSVHIDEVRPPRRLQPSMTDLRSKTILSLIGDAVRVLEKLEQSQDKKAMIQKETVLDMWQLIFFCIHKAVAISAREGTAVSCLRNLHELLMDESNEDQTPHLTIAFSKHILFLLQKKQEIAMWIFQDAWLGSTAAQAINMSIAGTFRRSCLRCLFEKMVPILAEVIECVDTNGNIDIILDKAQSTWKKDIWTNIFKRPEVSNVSVHQNFVSSQKSAEKQNRFIPRIPFSWVICRLIEDLLRTSGEFSTAVTTVDKGEGDDRIQKVYEMVSEAIGKELNKADVSAHLDDLAKDYIWDFVNLLEMSVTNQDTERELIARSLYILSKKSIDNKKPPTSVLVDVHIAYHTHKKIFSNFSSIVHVYPACIKELSHHDEGDDLTLDVDALAILMNDADLHPDDPNWEERKEEMEREWLDRVIKYRPVVELMLGAGANIDENEKRMRLLSESRSKWNKVVTLKMFMRNVLTNYSGWTSDIVTSLLLWSLMTDGGDLRNNDFIDCIELFLQQCNEEFFKYSKREFGECRDCKKDIPAGECAVLSCKHYVCQSCYLTVKSNIEQKKEERCKKCDAVISLKTDPKMLDKIDKQTFHHVVKYRRCCSGFYMNVVSQLCFANGIPPEESVIMKFLEYIINIPSEIATTMEMLRQKNFQKDADCVEMSQMLRFFLLQLLLQTCNEKTEAFFEKRFYEMDDEEGMEARDIERLTDIILFTTQAIEDSKLQELLIVHENDRSAKFEKFILDLRDVRIYLAAPTFTVKRLRAIAVARCSLVLAAQVMHDIYIEKSRKKNDGDEKFLDAVKLMIMHCSRQGYENMRNFLVKQLCRTYGLDSYNQLTRIARSNNLDWILVDLVMQEESLDYYLITDGRYLKLRKQLSKLMQQMEEKDVDGCLQGLDPCKTKDIAMMVLAIHRALLSQRVQKGSVAEDILHKLGTSLTKKLAPVENPSLKGTIDTIISNSVTEKIQQFVSEKTLTLHQQCMMNLCTHLATVISSHCNADLLQPFVDMLTSPHSLKESFFPTMVEETLNDVAQILCEQAKNMGESLKFYRCRNGHLYSIGDCGRPWIKALCPHCGSPIGGEMHNLLGDNKQDQGEDQTQSGYILGVASKRSRQAIPERKLPPIPCELMKFMMHGALFWASTTHTDSIAEIMPKGDDIPDPTEFFWDHLLTGFDILKLSLGKPPEDVFIILHCLINRINTNKWKTVKGERQNHLQSTEDRAKWEEDFLNVLLMPACRDQEEDVKSARNKLFAEESGSRSLLAVINEREDVGENMVFSAENLHKQPAIWRYRERVSLQHFANAFTTQTMSNKSDDFLLLRNFIEKNQILQALRFVPDILRLIKLLMAIYYRKLSHDDASQKTIEDHLQECEKAGTRHLHETLINRFCRAWDIIKNSLSHHVCRTLSGLSPFPKEYTEHKVTNKTTLEMLLPSTKGIGICCYALLEFLFMQQNEFLDKINSYSRFGSKVKVMDLMDTQIISYHPDEDIVPIILANSTYSFKYSEGTDINYDFVSFQSQLEDIVFTAKSLIDTSTIPLMTYSSEITDVNVLKTMTRGQEVLPQQAKRQISTEMKDLADIYNSLSNIFIAAKFLQTLPRNPEDLLDEFLSETLHIPMPLHSQKARQCCQIKHIKSLWISLSHDRARRLIENGKNAFDDIQSQLPAEMSAEDEESLSALLRTTSMDKLELLLEVLFEVILFRIPDNSEGEGNYVDLKEVSLYELLEAHLDDTFYTETESSGKRLDWNDMAHFPTEIKAGLAVEVWKCILNAMKRRNRESVS